MESNGGLCQQGRWRGSVGKVACEPRPGVLGGVIRYGGGSGGPGRGQSQGKVPVGTAWRVGGFQRQAAERSFGGRGPSHGAPGPG